MGTDDGYPWARRPTETNPAYEAFRVYLDLRSSIKTAKQLGKSDTLMTRWCAEHEWVARAAAFDTYLMNAHTDGAVDWITSARSETQRLADKLRGLLSDRLDDCIRLKTDPTVRWSNAATVLLRMQEHGIPPVDDTRIAAELDRVSKLVEKITGDAGLV